MLAEIRFIWNEIKKYSQEAISEISHLIPNVYIVSAHIYAIPYHFHKIRRAITIERARWASYKKLYEFLLYR